MKRECLQEHGLPPQSHVNATAGIYAPADDRSFKVQLTQHVSGWAGITESTHRQSRGFAHLAALGLVSMMLHYVIVKTVVLVGLIGMHKTGCSGETRLVLHVPSSS